MLKKYRYCCSVLLLAVVCGCATTSDKDTLLRSGYADLDTGNLKAADKKARKILNSWENNHSAALLRAEAAARAGNTRKAIDIITHMDYECRKDMCSNETSHMNALMLLTTLTNDENILRRCQEKIEELKKKISVRQHSTLVDYYLKNQNPHEASASFDKLLEASEGNLTSEQKLAGFILYYSTFEIEKAKELYNSLSPNQKSMVKQMYGDIQF